MAKLIRKIHKIAFHRNGVSGDGFHVVTFNQVATHKTNPEINPMLAIVFENPGQVAVLSIPLLSKGTIEFADNAWRGDVFEHELRMAIIKQTATP